MVLFSGLHFDTLSNTLIPCRAMQLRFVKVKPLLNNVETFHFNHLIIYTLKLIQYEITFLTWSQSGLAACWGRAWEPLARGTHEGNDDEDGEGNQAEQVWRCSCELYMKRAKVVTDFGRTLFLFTFLSFFQHFQIYYPTIYNGLFSFSEHAKLSLGKYF